MFNNRLTLCPNGLVMLFNIVLYILSVYVVSICTSVSLSIPSHCFVCAMGLVPEIKLD